MQYRAAEEKDLEALQTLSLASYGQLKKYLIPCQLGKNAGCTPG